MSDSTQPSPAARRAVLQAGSVTTSYWRAGNGAPVLLLAEGGAEGPVGSPLFSALASRFRVVAPGQAGNAVACTAWLRDLIDGLGLGRPHLVADAAHAAAVLRFAAMDPDRAGRLVFVQRDLCDPANHEISVDGSVGPGGQPLLLLRAEARPGLTVVGPELVRRMLQFLTEAPAPRGLPD